MTLRIGNTVGSLTEEQHSLVVGSLLGDGFMSCKTNAYLQITHSIKQKAYVDWKYQFLAPFVLTKPKSYLGNGKRIAYRFCTRSLPQFTSLYYQFYDNRKKIIPSDFQLTPFCLAIWFMDDGARNRKSVYFNTQQFSCIEQQHLLLMLKKQYGLLGALNKDKQYLRIRLFQSSANKLKNLIKPLIPSFMYYKLPL